MKSIRIILPISIFFSIVIFIGCEEDVSNEDFRGFWDAENGSYEVKITGGSSQDSLFIETTGYPRANRVYEFRAGIDGKEFTTQEIVDSSSYLVDLTVWTYRFRGELSEDGLSLFVDEITKQQTQNNVPTERTEQAIWVKN